MTIKREANRDSKLDPELQPVAKRGAEISSGEGWPDWG